MKEVSIKSYTRKTKSGKSVQVKAHTAKRASGDVLGKYAGLAYKEKYEKRKRDSITEKGPDSPYWKHRDNTREGIGKYLIPGESKMLKGGHTISQQDIDSYGGRSKRRLRAGKKKSCS